MRKTAVFTLLMLGVLSVSARSIDTYEAYSIAQEFFGTQSPSVATYSATTIKPAYTAVNDNNENTLYVFNNPANSGFVVIAGDDCVENVLGYCDNGAFDYEQAPPALLWLLEEYQCKIENAKGRDIVAGTSQSAFNKDAAPLIATQWGQFAPFNNLCPIYENDERCLTGCVATAMSQIMYYYKWPATGKGAKSYTTKTLGYNLSVDFSQTSYQWDKMTATYNENSTAEACNAVAEIMYHAGVASEMDYSMGSGTTASKAGYALIYNFSYDKSLVCGMRDYYTTAQWENLIVENIDNKMPIIYLGSSSSGGHAFILDGYNSKGLVHIDWGWNGYCNGYFNLSTLDALGDGDGYNAQQSAIFNIQPDKGTTDIAYEIMADKLNITNGAYVQGDNIDIEATRVLNGCVEKITFDLGIGFHDTNKNLVKSIKTCDVTLGSYYLYKSVTGSFSMPSGLNNGDYTIRLIYRVKGHSWEEVKMKGGEDYLYASIQDGIMRISDKKVVDNGINIYMKDGSAIPVEKEKIHFFTSNGQSYLSMNEGIAGTYSVVGSSAFQDKGDEEWEIEITYDNNIENRVWLHPLCLFGGLTAAKINPVYATYNTADNTLTLPLGQCLYGGAGQEYNMLVATIDDEGQPTTAGEVTLHITTQDNTRTIELNEPIGVGNAAKNEWWYQALLHITMTSRIGYNLLLLSDKNREGYKKRFQSLIFRN